MIGNTYVPPEGTRYQSLTPFQDLQEEVVKFDNCYICIAGDLNSHTGTVRDYIEINDFMPEQLDFDSEVHNHLSSIRWLQDHNISLGRSNVDHRILNNHGTQLIEFCKTNNLLICNGRLNCDKIGKATTSEGSLLDYLLASPAILNKIEMFSVYEFDAIFSDKHCRVSWSIKCYNQSHINIKDERSNLITIKKGHRNMWTSESATVFSNQINIDEVNNIKEDLDNSNTEINSILNDIQKLFKCTADKVLGHEYEYEIDINKKRKPVKFNRETLNIRNRYYHARRQYNGTDEAKSELANTSKSYKKAVMKAKALNRKQTIKELQNAKTKNPKFYWSVLNRQFSSRANRSSNAPPLDEFLNGFKALSGTDSYGEFTDETDNTVESGDDHNMNRELADQILNSEFTAEEIYLGVKELKNRKAPGIDKIINEFIKSSFNEMKLVYVDLFNRILNDGHIPEAWTIGSITPIYKNKGDKKDFNNYRGITILSCLGKLFTSVINARLNRYANEVNLINENQTGFRKKYSTLDHIFLLKNFIDIFVKNHNRKLYCAFVDYKKAFDTVWRSALWHKMIKSGITGKMLNVIVNMYNNIKSCVSCDGNLSDYFVSINGVRQGENLSPFLFALFINDIEQFLLQYGCSPIEISGTDLQTYLKLLIIMYADDTVLFASSKENLQECLNGLKQYCDKWKLQINTDKTKIIIFSKQKNNIDNINFTIGDENIEIVKEFKYLGVTFTHNGNFNKNLIDLKEQGNRAMFSIIKKARKGKLPIDIQFDLFDKVVMPVMLYGCEVWGYKNLEVLEKLHLKFCKLVLKLKKSTPDTMVYGESGRFKVEYYAKKRIINYWSTIACGNRNKLSYIMFDLCKQRYESGFQSSEWVMNLAAMLNSCGIDFIPNQEAIVKSVVKQMHINLRNEYICKWEDQVNNAPKCSVLYKHIKPIFEREFYISNLPYNLRLALSRIRTCNHKLPIEVGRYGRIYVPREERICTICDSGLRGDEFHFILVCTNPVLLELRAKYISPYYTLYPNLDKLTELFSNRGRKLFKLARYVLEGLKLY